MNSNTPVAVSKTTDGSPYDIASNKESPNDSFLLANTNTDE